MDKKHFIAVIIAHFYSKRDITDLLDDINKQKTNFKIEVFDIAGITPAAKARNNGAARAKSEILVFLDDDVRLGDDNTFSNLVKPLIEDENVGMCGASHLIPKDANGFQKKCAQQISHMQDKIMDNAQEVGVVGAACCAIKKDLFLAEGGFNAGMIRGEDQELCFRLQKKGLKIIRSAKAWIYHPPSVNLKEFIRAVFIKAKGVACIDALYPHLNIDTDPQGTIHPLKKRSIGYRLKRYSTRLIKAIFTLKLILVLDRMVYFFGYFWGFLKYRIFSKKSRAKNE